MSRKVLLNLGRALFLAAAVAFGWWWLRGDWPAVLSAMGSVGPVAIAAAVVAVAVGLVGSAALWLSFMWMFQHRVPATRVFSVFFVGQLGKYIPGSVWTFGAQAQMARRDGVPARTTVAVGLLFLGWNVATASAVGAVAGAMGIVDLRIPPGLAALAALAALLALVPPVTRWIAVRLAGSGTGLAFSWRGYPVLLALMLGVWTAFGLGIKLLDPAGFSPSSALSVATAVGVYSVAYAVGVVVILAPAGLGAREATLIFLLSPFVGAPAAAAIALLSRLVHTFCDFTLAGIGWVVGRRSMGREGDLPLEASG